VKKHTEPKKYLISFDSHTSSHVFTDVLIIGSGVAGLNAAIQAASHGSVLVVTKDRIDENNTTYAQGGIAVVLSEKDALIKHINDTLDAGQELCDKATVKTIVSEGPKRVREMIGWGAAFDRQNNHLIFTQEGGHSFPRIIRARGDSTGKEVEHTLVRVVKENKNIKVFEHTFAIDLITRDGVCHGAVTWHAKKGIVLSGQSKQFWRQGDADRYTVKRPTRTWPPGMDLQWHTGLALPSRIWSLCSFIPQHSISQEQCGFSLRKRYEEREEY